MKRRIQSNAPFFFMTIINKFLKDNSQPLLLSCLLMAGVYWSHARMPVLIPFLMLLLPLLDACWNCPDIKYARSALVLWAVPGLVVIALLWMNQSYTGVFFNILLLTALPVIPSGPILWQRYCFHCYTGLHVALSLHYLWRRHPLHLVIYTQSKKILFW